MQQNPYATPNETEPIVPHVGLGWKLYGSLIGLFGLFILGAELACILWAIWDSSFRRMLWSGGNPVVALAYYSVLGGLFIASARCAFKGQTRLALAFLFAPIAIFSLVLLAVS